MRSKRLRYLSMLVVLALALVVLSAATATAQPPYPVSDGSDEATPAAPARAPTRDIAKFEAKRWIVQLADAPLAKYEGGVGAMKATAIAKTGEAKLDVEKADSKAYIAYLEGKQKAFAGELSKAAPGAKVERGYQILFNGLAVAMNAQQAKAVSQLPGVAAVTPEQRYEMHMFSSLDLIGAPTMWGQVGGQANAGAGVKVAVIDSGIYVKYDANGQYIGNACFTDEGYSMPAGYPKGDTRFTNKKVIVARAYFRSYDPPQAGEDTPIQGTLESSPHGTHVAGTVACNAGTQATIAGLTLPISGVAPRAYLMNYRVFYPSQNPEWSGSFLDAEGIQALEDAVRDGADVINNSWGSNATLLPMTGPIDRALDAAAAAGVVVVHSNGNSGPDRATTGQASTAPQSISVAASTKGSTIAAGFVDVVAPAPVPANLIGRAFGSAQFGQPITSLFGPHPYVPIQTVDTSGSDLACGDPSTTIPAGSLTGKIALISRGVCNFSLKVWNAQQAGAIGAIIYNNAANGEAIITMAAGARADEVTIPSIHVARSMGLGMIAHYTANPGTATVQVDPGARVIASTADQVIGFSSRGPTTGLTLKPDVAAPGVNILSSGYGEGEAAFTGFGQVSGTSMAAPHVAGAAALLKQMHPTWRPWQIKSALMTTAKEEMTNIDGSPAGVLDRGAGRIDLTKAGNPGVVVDMPSLGGGRMTAGASKSFTIRVQDVSGAAGMWAVSTVETAHGESFDITVEPTTLNLAANGTASLTVRLATMAGAPSGDYEGSVVLVNSATGTRAHLPVWLRVLPATASKDVLLVDDDGSSIPNAGLANYSQVYTETLQTLGVSYDYLDVAQDAFPSLFDLYDYKAVVVFTGDNDSFNTSGFFGSDQNALSEWLDSGGRLLYTGQNLAETIDEENTGERLYEGNFGVKLATDDVFGGPAPRPSANGVGPMAGLTVDLSPGGDGAGNQTSVEAMRVISDTIGYNAATTILPLFRPIGGNAPADTAIAYSRSFEPSLEQPALQYLYRGVILGFGLEGVNSNTGHATRTQVADRALDWLLDTTTVSVAAATAQQYSPVNLTATATSSAGATITSYRWDFGDGSPLMSSASATVAHTYRAAGTYTVRVEVTNSLGHRSIGTTTVTVSPFACDPRNPSHLCNGILAVRAFIDFGCDTFFNRGTDWPLAGTTLRATLPDGTVRTSIVDMNGNATFNGLTLPDGGTVTISVDDPPLPTWARPQGYELTECPGVTTSVTVNRSAFSAGFNVGYLDLRYHFTQP